MGRTSENIAAGNPPNETVPEKNPNDRNRIYKNFQDRVDFYPYSMEQGVIEESKRFFRGFDQDSA
jgi:hypothetical protein